MMKNVLDVFMQPGPLPGVEFHVDEKISSRLLKKLIDFYHKLQSAELATRAPFSFKFCEFSSNNEQQFLNFSKSEID